MDMREFGGEVFKSIIKVCFIHPEMQKWQKRLHIVLNAVLMVEGDTSEFSNLSPHTPTKKSHPNPIKNWEKILSCPNPRRRTPIPFHFHIVALTKFFTVLITSLLDMKPVVLTNNL